MWNYEYLKNYNIHLNIFLKKYTIRVSYIKIKEVISP